MSKKKETAVGFTPRELKTIEKNQSIIADIMREGCYLGDTARMPAALLNLEEAFLLEQCVEVAYSLGYRKVA